jgi:gamma-glutamyltranspeptidase/glutathione hydrolase
MVYMKNNPTHPRRAMLAAVAALLTTCCGITPMAYANTALARHGMIASVQPVATDAGVAVLNNGGNAIDAAIETALTLGVVDAHNSGIGGGCFMLLHTADGKFYALDGREMAPAKATPTMFMRDGKGVTSLSQIGALASGVPGSLAVYAYAAEHFGKKKLSDLFEPPAKIAEAGFAIDASFARRDAALADTLKKFPASAAILLKPDGSPFKEGEILKNPDLAATYRALAANGISYFYGGPFAKAVEAWDAKNGGLLTADDFSKYQMKLREPLMSTYRGYTIVGFPPPSSGGTHVAEILNIMQNFDIAALEQKDPALRVHVIAEAMNRAFADRAFWMGDPDFVKVPRGLLDPAYAADLAKSIDLTKASVKIDHGTPPNADTDIFGKHTTHIAAADDQGNWVAITTTVNTSFGSKVIIPGTGVVMNDQMDDFSIAPNTPNAFHLIGSEANLPGPGKRPLSSMSPTIVMRDGQVQFTVGAAGGPTIITQVLLVTSNLIDLHDDLTTAMARPRFHDQWFPEEIKIERTFPQPVLDELKKMGHTLNIIAPTGATNAILRHPDGVLEGVSEPRLESKAAGE